MSAMHRTRDLQNRQAQGAHGASWLLYRRVLWGCEWLFHHCMHPVLSANNLMYVVLCPRVSQP